MQRMGLYVIMTTTEFQGPGCFRQWIALQSLTFFLPACHPRGGTGSYLPALMIAAEHAAGFREGHHQPHRFDARRPEAMPFVKGLRLGRDRVHPDSLSGRQHAQHRVAEEIAAEAPPLPRAIDGQPPKQHDWDRVRHVPPHPPGRDSRQNGAGGEAVVTNHSPAFAHDEGPETSFDLVMQGMTF